MFEKFGERCKKNFERFKSSYPYEKWKTPKIVKVIGSKP